MTSKDSTPSGLPESLFFDEQKLKNAENPEKQELYLFNWLANLERELKKINKETLKDNQANLEKQLLRFISLSSPKPHRPIRQIIARCFIFIYENGDTRTLFDTITALQSLIGTGKGIGEKETKLAALHCIGHIMKSVGDKVLSLLPETVNICLKTIKNTTNALIVRLEAIYTITRALEGAGKGSSEPVIKDITKCLKLSLTDKALIIRVASVECMRAIIKYAPQSAPTGELDLMLNQMFKVLDGSNQTIRRAVASFIATLLADTQEDSDSLMPTSTSSNITSSKGKSSGPNNQNTTLTPESPTSALPPESSKSPFISPNEMLSHLSTFYNKSATTREMRAAIVETYSTLFIQLGTKYVESNYATIAQHLLGDLVSNTRNASSRYEVLSVREHCGLLLRDVIGTRLLSEQGQVFAVRELVNGWVKKWPAIMPNDIEPNKLALVCAVNEISGLLLDLGGAASTVQDVLIEPLITLLGHPSYSVQISTAWCLRCLCFSLPSKLSELITNVLDHLNKDLKDLNTFIGPSTPLDLFKRTLGHAHGLAALMSVIRDRPLDVDFEVSARVFSLSTQLIKASSNRELRVASLHIQVAWTLIGSLMCLGPNFVKLHLPQLLLLWKTVLPKPSSKETHPNHTELEWTFMFHVRECVLSAMLCFLLHNAKLVTADVAKRLVALLNNTLTFISLIPSSFQNPQPNSLPLPSSLKFSERDNMLRRRIFQCFVAIRPVSAYENLSSQLLQMSLSNFADPEKHVGSTITAAIAAVSGSFTSVWTASDEYAFGVSSKLRGMDIDFRNIDGNPDDNVGTSRDWLNRDLVESKVESQLEQPVLGAPEHDSLMIYTTYWSSSFSTFQLPKPVPPATVLVDSSIEFFATVFPLQNAAVQESLFEQLIKVVRHPKLEKSPGRKMAVQVNMVIGLLGTFKVIMSASSRRGDSGTPMIAHKKVGALAMELLQAAIVHPDPYLRNAASDALGRLISIVGGNLIPTQIQLLVDQVVNNRDPDTRAGSALALGNIYSHVGGMAAGNHLKTLVGILLSLSKDPHPVVHFWALYALAKTIESAGLMFSQYVSSTIATIAKLYMAETHEPGGGSVATTNVGLGLSAYQQFGKIIFGLIGTLGPELQAHSIVRDLCLNLTGELKNDDEQLVIVESIRCLQHFIMFAHQYVDLPDLIRFLQSQLSSMHLPLKKVAVTCLYQLVQRNARHVFEMASPGLDQQLFSLLDTDPTVDGVKDIVISWLNQTAIETPSIWVELCRKVMSKTGSVASAGAPVQPPSLDIGRGDDDIIDEEGDGFDIGQTIAIPPKHRNLEKTTASDAVQIPPRWRTQFFALRCLHQVVEAIYVNGNKDHFNLAKAKEGKREGKDYLVLRIADLIKMAFTASTAVVSEMRLEGLTVLRDVIEKFAATPDPDYEEAVLLEQYQAQIGAALTPAFSGDTSPEILSAAVKVCAVFVGSGIVKELYRMGRILKLLTTALENSKEDSSITTVAGVKDLSPHASIMVKLSVLNAWAELQVASTKQSYLVQVVEPNLRLLCPLWVGALRDYARVQVEPEIESQANSNASTIPNAQNDGFDSMYIGLTREVILPYYNRSWLKILAAIASLVDVNNNLIISAINGDNCVEDKKIPDNKDNQENFDDFLAFENESKTIGSSDKDIIENTKSNDTTKYFYILFGLCVEALSKTFGGSNNSREDQIVVLTCLDALKALLRPVSAGRAFLEKPIFIELINLLDRLALTEGFKAQYVIIQIIKEMITFYGPDYLCNDLKSIRNQPNGHLQNKILTKEKSDTKIYHILRLLTNIFFQKIPSLSSRSTAMRVFRAQANTRAQPSQETILVLKNSLEALTSLISIVPSKYKIDLSAIVFYIFISIIHDEKFQNDLVPHVLVNVKTLCENLEATIEDEDLQGFSRVIDSTIMSLLSRIQSFLLNGTIQPELSEDDVSIVKNSLLAIVLVLSTCTKANFNVALQNDFTEILKNGYYWEKLPIAITSLQCTRTLVMLATKNTNPITVEVSHHFTKSLMPQVALFLHSIKESVSNLTRSHPKFTVIEEAIKTLLALYTAAAEEHKSTVLATILSTLVHLLEEPPLENPLPPLHSIAISHVFFLATNYQSAFKDVLSTHPPPIKSKLEACIRFNVLEQQQQQRQLQEERERELAERNELTKAPTISLRSDFTGFA
ncbi:7812_t:CDS:10 [Ambispora gerdemannii]|uniref:7812_t:CDS:1 n=1 Tax=Ambispora gerdemannii TaxID=144530 RepID=A0A9N8Z3Z9_9GLOM|nr:7812_t:CDS:10 [Ambispora gerdemannii]